MKKLFTSESVTEGHPDKMADQISDSILDAIMAEDPMGRVAAETLVTTGQVHVVGEISTKCYVDIPHIIRKTVKDIGYTRAKYGFDAETCGILVSLDEQRDSIVWPSVCDRLSWCSPLVQSLGIRELPFYILADTAQRIVAFGSSWNKDIAPALPKH